MPFTVISYTFNEAVKELTFAGPMGNGMTYFEKKSFVTKAAFYRNCSNLISYRQGGFF